MGCGTDAVELDLAASVIGCSSRTPVFLGTVHRKFRNFNARLDHHHPASRLLIRCVPASRQGERKFRS